MKRLLSFRSDLIKNAITLITGTAISQALPIALSPILTRLYTPEDFGNLAIFISLTAIIGSVITGKYELAIMLPKSDFEAIVLVKLSILVSLFISLLLLTFLIVFNDFIFHMIGENKIGNWLYFVPLSAFLIGVYTTLNVYNNRLKKYKLMSRSMINKSLGLSIVQTSLGAIKFNGGLILGQFAAYLFGNAILSKPLFENKIPFKRVSKLEMKSSAFKYVDFLKFSMPGVLMNSLSINLNNFLITYLFNSTTLGFYAFSNKILGLPSAIFGSNLSTLYFQKLSSVRSDSNASKNVFMSFLRKLVFISFPVFLLLFFIVKPVFPLVFGENWAISGEIAQFLIPMFFIRFISSALSPTIDIYERQFYSIVINLVLLFSILLVVIISKIFSFELLHFIKLLSFFLSFSYALFILIYYRIISTHK